MNEIHLTKPGYVLKCEREIDREREREIEREREKERERESERERVTNIPGSWKGTST